MNMNAKKGEVAAINDGSFNEKCKVINQIDCAFISVLFKNEMNPKR